MNQSGCIYALSTDGATHRYVGLTTKSVLSRLDGHKQSARHNSQAPVHKWIRKHGADSIMVVVLEETHDDFELADLERKWIERLGAKGFALLNLTEGGDGVVRRCIICTLHPDVQDTINRMWVHATTLNDRLDNIQAYLSNIEYFNIADNDLMRHMMQDCTTIRKKRVMQLTEFASVEEHNSDRKTRCKTCNLPDEILAQIHEARAQTPKPISFPVISKWLKSEGIDITQATIRNHFVAGHDNV